MSKIEWLGHAQHFIGCDDSQFWLATLVGGKYVISTVGDYMMVGKWGRRMIGANRYFETYVFVVVADERRDCGCPVIKDYAEIDSLAANTAQEATTNHMAMIKKYRRKAAKEGRG